MRILVSYRAIPQSPGWATGDFVVQALRGLGHEVWPYAKLYQSNDWLISPAELREKSYDLLIYMEMGDGETVYPELATVAARRIVTWGFDTELYPERWLSIINLLRSNKNFLANQNLLDLFPNSYYLPYAADYEKHYRPISYISKNIDVSMVGSDRPERRLLIEKLNNGGINAKLVTGVFREEYIETLNCSKIVLNDNAGGGRIVPMRPFEAIMAGSLLVDASILYKEYADLKLSGLFKSPVESLVDGCKDLLSMDKENYERLAKDGQDDVIKNHTYHNRVKELLR